MSYYLFKLNSIILFLFFVIPIFMKYFYLTLFLIIYLKHFTYTSSLHEWCFVKFNSLFSYSTSKNNKSNECDKSHSMMLLLFPLNNYYFYYIYICKVPDISTRTHLVPAVVHTENSCLIKFVFMSKFCVLTNFYLLIFS